jgi:hypothetical protein
LPKGKEPSKENMDVTLGSIPYPLSLLSASFSLTDEILKEAIPQEFVEQPSKQMQEIATFVGQKWPNISNPPF